MDITTGESSKAAPAVATPTKAAPAPLAATATAALIPFKLADIGEGIAEVEVLKWFVKVRHDTYLCIHMGTPLYLCIID